MCGIFGIYSQMNEPLGDSSILRGMCAAIAHHGPDQEGVYLNEKIGLGVCLADVQEVIYYYVNNEPRARVLRSEERLHMFENFSRGI